MLLPLGLGRLGFGLAAGCGCGALIGLGGSLAAVLGFGWVAGAGLVGVWALAAAGLLAVVAVVDLLIKFLVPIARVANECTYGICLDFGFCETWKHW